MFGKYVNKSWLWDLLLVVAIVITLYICKKYYNHYFILPAERSVEAFGVSLLTVSATLIGFLLTIITVIVTFKKGFEPDEEGEQVNNKLDPSVLPEVTVFDKKVSKEKQFYNSKLFNKVVKVFVEATFQVGLALLALLILQFDLFSLSRFVKFSVHFVLLIIVLLPIIRSMYIFNSFLKVHSNKKF